MAMTMTMSVAQTITFWIILLFVYVRLVCVPFLATAAVASTAAALVHNMNMHALLVIYSCVYLFSFLFFFLVYSCEMFPILMEWKNIFRLQKYLGGLYMVDFCWCCYCGFPFYFTYSCVFPSRACICSSVYTFVLFYHGFPTKSLYTKNESQTLGKSSIKNGITFYHEIERRAEKNEYENDDTS